MAPTTLSSILSPEALNTQQKLVLKLVAQGCSLFFTGSAGTGKSVCRHIVFISFLTKNKQKFCAAVCSQTHPGVPAA